MSKTGPFFVLLPWEFFDAWLIDRKVKRTHVLTALYVAGRCFEARNTGGGIAPVELSTVARLCDVSSETIRRTFHDLRDWGWLDFQVGDGGDPAWRIWLTGLSREKPSPRPLHDLSTETPPPVWRGLSTDPAAPISANSHREKESAATTSPQSNQRPLHRRDETRELRAKRTDALGKTTAGEASECEPEDPEQIYNDLIAGGYNERSARNIADAWRREGER